MWSNDIYSCNFDQGANGFFLGSKQVNERLDCNADLRFWQFHIMNLICCLTLGCSNLYSFPENPSDKSVKVPLPPFFICLILD